MPANPLLSAGAPSSLHTREVAGSSPHGIAMQVIDSLAHLCDATAADLRRQVRVDADADHRHEVAERSVLVGAAHAHRARHPQPHPVGVVAVPIPEPVVPVGPSRYAN